MFIRGITTIVACIATVVFASGAEAQDTTRTRDTMQMHNQMQMQRQGAMMTAQARDSMIARLLDSANRSMDPMLAQRLRDSVTTLRAVAVSDDNMRNMGMTTMQQQQQQQQQNMQQRQPSPMTSDQRVRMQKDGRSYPDNTPTSPTDPSNR